MGAFFGYVFGGSSNNNPGQTRILLVDQDNSAVSSEITAKLKGEKMLLVETANLEQARSTVQKGKASVAVVIPPQFGKNAADSFFTSGSGKPNLTILFDPSRQMESKMIQGMLTGDVMQAVSKQVFGGEEGRRVAAQSLAELKNNRTLPEDQRNALVTILDGVSKYVQQPAAGGTQTGLTIPFDTTTEALTSSSGVPYNAYGHSFGGFSVQFILFVGVDVGIGLLLTKQRGLWNRFRAAPLSKGQLLGSRIVSAAFISLVILCVVFIAARLLFQVRIEGSLTGFLLLGAALGLMTATYGLLIATLGKTPEAARGLSILGTLVMTMLSGAWVPSFVFPAWLQSLTKVVPARWAVDGLDGVVWRGFGFREALVPALVLTAFAIAFGLIAISRFRWEDE
jgi:ABC-2 type transport system permease protein